MNMMKQEEATIEGQIEELEKTGQPNNGRPSGRRP